MNDAAYQAVSKAWALTVKARALCPYTDESDESWVGTSGCVSSPWYRERGALYFVISAQPLTKVDVQERNEIGEFVNRSFIISVAAILEEHGVVPYGKNPDTEREGGHHAQLVKWMRHRFAHGEWDYDPDKQNHVKTRRLLEELFPEESAKGSGFVTSIDKILEPLKDGVLAYIRAAT